MAPTRTPVESTSVWHADEDARLRALVDQYGSSRGKQSRWSDVAAHMPGRSVKACRKRWFYSLDPSVKRSNRWTQDEDARLLTLVELYGKSWVRVAQDMPGRTDDMCSARFYNVLESSSRDWSAEEDALLLLLHEQQGNKWSEIARQLQGRSALACRNRCRKFHALVTQRSSTRQQQRRTETPTDVSSTSSSPVSFSTSPAAGTISAAAASLPSSSSSITATAAPNSSTAEAEAEQAAVDGFLQPQSQPSIDPDKTMEEDDGRLLLDTLTDYDFGAPPVSLSELTSVFSSFSQQQQQPEIQQQTDKQSTDWALLQATLSRILPNQADVDVALGFVRHLSWQSQM